MPPTLSIFPILFRLKYLEGVTDYQKLSEMLGCLDPKTVIKLDEDLTKLLESKIGELTPDRLELVCPECLNARVYEDPETGERVCGYCGAVLDNVEYDESLPYDTTYALTSDLAYDKSLGGTLNGKALMRVLAQSPGGNADLGLRARLVKVVVETVEHPLVKKAKKKAYELSRIYGLETDYIFNNDVGRLLQQAYYVAKTIDEPTVLRNMAETCFWLCLIRYGKKELAERFKAENNINTRLVMAFKRAKEIKETVRNTRITPVELAYFIEIV